MNADFEEVTSQKSSQSHTFGSIDPRMPCCKHIFIEEAHKYINNFAEKGGDLFLNIMRKLAKDYRDASFYSEKLMRERDRHSELTLELIGYMANWSYSKFFSVLKWIRKNPSTSATEAGIALTTAGSLAQLTKNIPNKFVKAAIISGGALLMFGVSTSDESVSPGAGNQDSTGTKNTGTDERTNINEARDILQDILVEEAIRSMLDDTDKDKINVWLNNYLGVKSTDKLSNESIETLNLINALKELEGTPDSENKKAKALIKFATKKGKLSEKYIIAFNNSQRDKEKLADMRKNARAVKRWAVLIEDLAITYFPEGDSKKLAVTAASALGAGAELFSSYTDYMFGDINGVELSAIGLQLVQNVIRRFLNIPTQHQQIMEALGYLAKVSEATYEVVKQVGDDVLLNQNFPRF